MKILIFSQYYYPEQFQINEIAPELVRRGHEVTVVTGLPNYPSGEIDERYLNFKDEFEVIDGVKVIRCPIRPRKKGLFNLFLNYMSYMRLASKKVKKLEEYDVVFSYQLSPITQVKPALKYKKKFDKKLIIYCLDLYPLSGSVHYKKIPFMYSYVHATSKKLYNSADIIAVSSETFIPYLNEVNQVVTNKMVYLPQHADSAMIDMDLRSEDNGVVDFMFAGNIGRGPRLETLVKAVDLLRDESNFKVHIVGDGSYLETLKNKVKESSLEDYFVFHGYHKRSEMPAFYKLADVLYISLRKGNFTLPAKFQTYLSTGKPIVGAIDGAACKIMDELHCGTYAPAENAQALAGVMRTYIQGTAPKVDERKIKEYFRQNYTLQRYVDKLEELLTD